MLYLGNTNSLNFRLGNTQVTRLYLGSTLVWSNTGTVSATEETEPIISLEK